MDTYKFKVGDIVKVVLKSDDNNAGWMPAMDAFIGEKAKVRGTSSTGNYLLYNPEIHYRRWYFSPECLQPESFNMIGNQLLLFS